MLFDPRMGVLDPGLICPTDGLDYMKGPILLPNNINVPCQSITAPY